jgi:ribosomal protein S18 acetylase RimI-like enzyme
MKQQLFVNCRKCIFCQETRGLGIGSQVMAVCLQSAKTLIENCYLETMPFMHDAQKLYKKVGLNTLMLPARDMSLAGLDVEEIIGYEL